MSVFKQLLILCCLGGIGYGGWAAYGVFFPPEAETTGGRPDRAVVVEVAVTRLQSIPEIVEAVGTTRALRSVEIVPQTEGKVMSVKITPGARVTAGDVLVQLDDVIEQADLTEAEARLLEQRQIVTRIEQLRLSNAVAQATQDEATAQLAAAEAQLNRARQRLDNRAIKAPFDGVVGLSEVDAGARIEAGDMITRLDDLSQVELEFSLPETLFGRVTRGLPVSATSPAFPNTVFEGQIEAVDSRIDPVGRSFRTRAVLPNPEGLLPAGMFMSLDLVLSRTQALTLPEAAIVFQAAETYVFVIADDVATRTSVRTGQRRDGRIAILSGLNEGDKIAIRGLARLRDQSKVSVVDAAKSPTPSTDGDT